MSYIVTQPFKAYEEGTVLRDVTLAEARSWECNRCGDCCNGLSDYVKKDEPTGLPMFTWGSEYPPDLYRARYGKPLIQPIVLGDGGPQLGADFERDETDRPYTAFVCAFLREGGITPEGETTCELHGKDKDPSDLSTIRPRNCGEFPIFSSAIDDALIGGHTFIPPTGALPRCTWHGIRIVGPYRDTPEWRKRWQDQQLGLPVPDLSLPPELVDVPALIAKTQQRRATEDGSRPRT